MVFISIRFYGFKKWIKEILNDPVYFIFPILSSLSFYEKSKSNDENERLSYLPNISPTNSQTVETAEQPGNIENMDNPGNQSAEKEKQFSIWQSNILYLLFCVSSSLCIYGDFYHQWKRG